MTRHGKSAPTRAWKFEASGWRFIEKGMERFTMVDYERMYKVLFNGITDAIDSIEAQNYGAAKDRLIRTQQDAEEIFMEDGEDGDDAQHKNKGWPMAIPTV
jgi:hypothetical protein